LFRENNIPHEKINYFEEPLTESKIKSLLKKLGMSPREILRTKDEQYKALINEKTSDEKIVELIAKNPNLLQRPIIEIGDRAIIARPAEKVIDFIKANS